jgi:hypothetical protein
MISSPIKRLGLLAAFVSLGASALAANDRSQQIKIDRAINSPTLAVKYNGVHAALMELRINGESFGTRTVDEAAMSGETTFTLNVLNLKDGDNDIEVRLYDKAGHVVGSEKTVITTDSDTKGPVFLSTPKVGESVQGPCEISVGFGRDFKNSYVSFFIDNQFKSMMNFPPFTFTWDTSRETNGWHEVEAWIVDDSSSTYKTRKVRVFVNNPGGHTFRPATPAIKTTPKPTVTAAVATKAAVKTVARATKAVKAATKIVPLPDPSKNLTPIASQVIATTTAVEAPIKTLVHAMAVASAAKTTAITPAVVGLTVDNSVTAKLEGQSAGVKPAPMPQSTSVGPRLMTPTGRRVVATKTAPAATAPVKAATVSAQVKTAPPTTSKAVVVKSAPFATESATANPVSAIAEGASATTKPVPAPTSEASKPVTTASVPKVDAPAPDPRTLIALVPVAKTEAPAATFHPLKIDATGEGTMSKPNASSSEPSAPAVPAPAVPTPKSSPEVNSMGSTDSYVKPVKLYPNTATPIRKPARALLAVKFGTKLPIKAGTYTITYNGSPVMFDVAPSIHAGVPVSPFRHLIEKSGGTINWLADDHEVTAISDGRNIWLKIGDQYAKIDSEAVKLELAPFIENGRTIVPLSFIRAALNVNVDFDKTTGHVFITAKK